jgi:hypothetical protein
MIAASLGASPSSSWLVWLVLIAVCACIGGVFVFVGLLLEKVFEKKAYRNMVDFWRCKSWREKGWKILMLGIFIEIVSAAAFAVRGELEMRQIRINEAKNNPLNQPVADISARLVVKLKGADFNEGTRPTSAFAVRGTLIKLGTNGAGSVGAWLKPGAIFGFFSVTNAGGGLATIVNGSTVSIISRFGYQSSQFGVLESDGFHRMTYPQEDNHGYNLNFNTAADYAPDKLNRRPTVIEVISNANWLDIWCDFIPTNSEVISGLAEVVINGSSHMEFHILPKKGETGTTTNGFGFGMIATNAIVETNDFPSEIQFRIKDGQAEIQTNTTIPARIIIEN